jgi:DNA-binding transcriptional ArsR family regulator
MPKHPDPATLAEISTHCACFNLRRAARAVTQLYDHTLAPSGLRATQVTLLVALAKAGPVPFTRLASALGMDRTTLTRNLAPLERDGFVTQSPGADRRVKLVRITDAGLATSPGHPALAGGAATSPPALARPVGRVRTQISS